LVNQPKRVFKTRFDKPVSFQPSPRIVRMSANAETEILNPHKSIKRKRRERRFA
jgi:hypothetical protein